MAQDPGGTMKRAASLASTYLELLSAEGYRPQVASDGVPVILRFKAEGEDYLLLVEEGDPHFFHVASAYDLGDIDFFAAVARANELNEELKGTKTTVWAPDRSIRIHVESFVDEPPGRIGLLERAVGAIQIAARKFFEAARSPDQLDA